MTQRTPDLQQRILEAWLNGTASFQELAERFNVSSTYVRQVLHPFRRNENAVNRLSIMADTLSIARGIFNVLPAELTNSFRSRFEEAAGGRPGLLLAPVL